VSDSLPALHATVGGAVAAGFGLLSRARSDRALHARGSVWTATATFARPVAGVPALSEPCEIDALLRLSRAVGLPRMLPDILGLALRLHDFDAKGRPLDLLLASSPAPPAHRTLAPARSFERTWFTGLLRYRIGERQTILVAHVKGPGHFALGTADPRLRQVKALADIRVKRLLDPAPPEASSFDPILHASPTFRQAAGRLDAIRARAYRASRTGRSG
jgi:hypothetical protein